MARAILDKTRTDVRDLVKGLVTHVGLSTDSTAFAAGQTVLNPGGGTNLIKTATKSNFDAFTFDATITVNGDTEFTGLVINTVGACKGGAAGDAMTRSVRGAGLGIGVQAGDNFTIGPRWGNTDAS